MATASATIVDDDAVLCGGKVSTIIGSGTISGTAGDDVIVGSNGDDTIDGLGGDDIICALNGNDTITDGAGDDVVFAGAGTDRFVQDASMNGADDLHGEDGTDTVDYSQRTTSVTVTLAGAADDGAAGEGDGISTVERVRGGNAADTMTGADTNDTLIGGAGDDTLTGGGGSDRVVGGDGSDDLHIDDGVGGNDTADGGSGTDTAVADPGDSVARVPSRVGCCHSAPGKVSRFHLRGWCNRQHGRFWPCYWGFESSPPSCPSSTRRATSRACQHAHAAWLAVALDDGQALVLDKMSEGVRVVEADDAGHEVVARGGPPVQVLGPERRALAGGPGHYVREFIGGPLDLLTIRRIVALPLHAALSRSYMKRQNHCGAGTATTLRSLDERFVGQRAERRVANPPPDSAHERGDCRAVEVGQRQEQGPVRSAQGQGHVQTAGRQDRQLAEGVQARRREVAQRVGQSNQGGTTAQHKAAGRKGGKAAAKKS